MNDISQTKWFQIVDKLWRPITSWGLGLATVAYAMRAVLGLPFVETYFAAIAAASGFAYLRRGQERIREKELEE